MPRFGDEMVEGTIVRWLVGEGDEVQVGDVIAEVETDKAIVELEAEADGWVLSVLRYEGATVPVGEAIAHVGSQREAKPARRPLNAGSPERESAVQARHASEPEAASMRAGYPARLPDANGRIELGVMGVAIARRTLTTAQTVPQFDLTVRIDMTAAIEFRREMNKSIEGGSGITVNDMIVKACAGALSTYPVYNSRFAGNHLEVQPHVNVGLAVALADGLLVPAVLDCDRKSLAEIAVDAKDVAERAKRGTVGQDEYFGTFTVSNLGAFTIDAFSSLIVSPQVGVLAIGSVHRAPVAVGSNIEVRQMMAATLSTDHRAAGGAEAAQFANEVQRRLEDPRLLEGQESGRPHPQSNPLPQEK
jgi:pyruvate dehydrogenase E2 component (dihydrolipoamide acetyltransferase)